MRAEKKIADAEISEVSRSDFDEKRFRCRSVRRQWWDGGALQCF